MANDQLTSDDEKLRGSIATRVLKYGTLTLSIIGAIIIIAGIILLRTASDSVEKDKAISLIVNVFHALLPVIATWVGTVIAFYFGKANFEAASKSVQDMAKQITNSDDKLKAIKVSDRDVMRLFADISYNKDIAGKEDKDINVQKDLLDFIDTNKKGDRLPILNTEKIVRYILHESTINEFARKLSSGKYPALKDKKFEEIALVLMIDSTDEEMKNKLTKSLVFVSKTATLFEAKEKMESNQWSQDVFVTENGNAAEPIIGWITNNKISELSKV